MLLVKDIEPDLPPLFEAFEAMVTLFDSNKFAEKIDADGEFQPLLAFEPDLPPLFEAFEVIWSLSLTATSLQRRSTQLVRYDL